MSAKWDLRFLGLSKHIAGWSKDPSTKTGAVIVDRSNRVISVGYNGFARGVEDSSERLENRDVKYKMVIHCERNAMLFAERSLHDCTLYTWPFGSCSPCAAMVIQSGITRVVFPTIPDHLIERWGQDLEMATMMFHEAGVAVTQIDHAEIGA